MTNIEPTTDALLNEISTLISEAKQNASVAVNVSLSSVYWRIGQRINQEVLQGERAEYGKQIVASLARQLTENFGRGFSEKQLRRMMQFAEVFPNFEIVASLMRQLSWTHFIELLQLDESGIHVAEYLTVLPEREALHKRLQHAIDEAQKRYAFKDKNR